MAVPAELMREVLGQCSQLDGVNIAEGAFSPGLAVWLGKREIAHFDHDGALDVRLTRQLIRRRRSELAGDDRIVLRDAVSDWLEFRLAEPSDLEFAVSLVTDAVGANAATAQPGTPPTGEALARRRRFH